MKTLLEQATRYQRDRVIGYQWKGETNSDGVARCVDLVIRHSKERRVFVVSFERYGVEHRDGFAMRTYGLYTGDQYTAYKIPVARFSQKGLHETLDSAIFDLTHNATDNALRFICEAAALTMLPTGAHDHTSLDSYELEDCVTCNKSGSWVDYRGICSGCADILEAVPA
jgi:hypothetical protein